MRLGREPHPLLVGLGVAAAYVMAARVGFLFASAAEQVTTVWAPTGISLAALLLWGPALWPAIWVGAFIANLGSEAPLWTAALIATGNTLEGVAATWLLRQLPHFDPTLRRVRDVLAFILLGAGASVTVSATIGVSTLCAAAVQPWERFAELWWAWWLGDALGALVVSPVLLTSARSRPWSRRQWADTVLLAASVVIATQIVFGQAFGPTTANYPLQYVIFPFVIAAAVRSGQAVTALVVLAGSVVAIWNTAQGAGPFAGPTLHQRLVLLQTFLGVLAGTGLLLAAAIAERRIGERRRAAAYAVGHVMVGAPSLLDAAPHVLRAICESLDWDFAALWLVDTRARCLRCHAVSSDATVPFAATTRATPLEKGIGLPGRVWASGAPAWIVDVGEDSNFPRASAAREAGLHGAFAFPIDVDSQVAGVIECFHRDVQTPDPDLLRTMSVLGAQIGQFIGRKQAEQGREQLLAREAAARSEAEAANRAKDEFLATLSHELRTPLNAIVGWTHMLLDGNMDAASTRRALEVIARNANLQSQLVADILDVSRIITGGVRLDVRPVDLGAIVGAALDAVRPAANARQVQLRSSMTGATHVVKGDPQRLQQVVWNLLSNAVKFTEAGGVVSVTIDGGPRDVHITVHDTGAGIDAEFLPHVFERFRQADSSASRHHGGLGLGLSIVRHLVELHGGTVRVESSGAGQGSTFTVTFPLAKVETPV